jgi:hypothetical protein
VAAPPVPVFVLFRFFATFGMSGRTNAAAMRNLRVGTRHFRSVAACRAVTTDVPADVDGVVGIATEEIYAVPILGFEGWYRCAHPDVLTTIALGCGSMDIAAEATDEAFARALAQWPRVCEMRSPTGWVVVVAFNLARKRARR